MSPAVAAALTQNSQLLFEGLSLGATNGSGDLNGLAGVNGVGVTKGSNDSPPPHTPQDPPLVQCLQ